MSETFTLADVRRTIAMLRREGKLVYNEMPEEFRVSPKTRDAILGCEEAGRGAVMPTPLPASWGWELYGVKLVVVPGMPDNLVLPFKDGAPMVQLEAAQK